MNRPMIFFDWNNKLKLPPASFTWKIKLSLQNVAVLTFITSHYRDETSLLNCFAHHCSSEKSFRNQVRGNESGNPAALEK